MQRMCSSEVQENNNQLYTAAPESDASERALLNAIQKLNISRLIE